MSEWIKLTESKYHDRKWALTHGGVLLATIFKKPTKEGDPEVYSLYVCSPKVYVTYNEIMTTHTFPSLEEAQQGFEDLGVKEVCPWAYAIVDYFE